MPQNRTQSDSENSSSASDENKIPPAFDRPDIDLRDANLAALLAWLIPGAGHIYQGRYGKGALFMICILGTFLYGLTLGGNRVVYASWKENDRRWQYVCQFGVGLSSFPAVIQYFKTKNGDEPYFQIAKRYPAQYPGREFEILTPEEIAEYDEKDFGPLLIDGFMAPPAGGLNPNSMDVLGMWHKEFNKKFEMGTLFTVVAGLLNILAIYDAYAGPAYEDPENKKKKKKDKLKEIENESE